MQNPPSKGIADLLVAAGFTFGGVDPWAVYIGRRPDLPKAVVTIYDSGGGTPNPRWLIDYPSVQVRVRGNVNDYEESWLKAKEIKNIILGQPSQDLNGDRWVHFNMAGDIGFLGYDQTNHPEFSLNFNLIIEPANDIGNNRDPL